MLELISYEQFLEWRAFDELDPFGEERMVTTLANVNRRQHSSAYTRDQFMLYFGDNKRVIPDKQPWEQMKAVGQYVFAMIGDGKSQGS